MSHASQPKKTLILNILGILQKYSDENHRLTAKGIGDHLREDYGQQVDRKAIKRNLMNLLTLGLDIECTKSQRENPKDGPQTLLTGWYMNRTFTDAELRLLIDGLLFSKQIPNSQCKDLIGKLEGLSNIYFKAKAQHIQNMPEHAPENKELFYTIEILDEAITEERMVSFHYTEYGTDKLPHRRRDQQGIIREYRASPYQMAATNGRHYLICNLSGKLGLSNYRVDRIVNIRMLEEAALPLQDITGSSQGLNLPQHMAEHVYMFSGESRWVTFRANKRIISDILDWFDKDVAFHHETDTHVEATLRVNEQAMFYWALQYGEVVEVLSPESLRTRLREATAKMAAKYEAPYMAPEESAQE